MQSLSIPRCRLSKIEPLRALFLQELNAQCRYDAAHMRKGTSQYLIRHEGRAIGYGAVKDTHESRGTLFEFYLLPVFRDQALTVLGALVDACEPEAFECQSNDLFYAALVRRMSSDLTSDTILFAIGPSNGLHSPGTVVRRRQRGDRVFEHTVEPVGDFVVDVGGDVVGTGGFLLHYNPPFADLFMEVRPDARRRGYGSFLIQELITECYLAGRVPAARTSLDNIASQRTLLKGGLRECGRMVRVRLGQG
ncbi:MAG TPA: GNAT family N-acetyltransferase [Vicinamibacterales bacterium]|jgi:GNAT superfamily N-acetyltransferase